MTAPIARRRALAAAVAVGLCLSATVAWAAVDRVNQPATATRQAQRLPVPTTTVLPTPTTWTTCANEFQGGCSYDVRFPGVRQMRFGSPVTNQWVYGMFSTGLGPASCNAGAFGATGDVAPGQPKECQYANTQAFTTLPAPTVSMGPTVDRTRIPVGDPGWSRQIRTTAGQVPASGDGVGAFRIVCLFSHMSFDDPIVYPGQVGRSHLHSFFGNTATNANSTADSIANQGSSTCFGGTANRTAYWVPSIIDTRDGVPVTPRTAIFYYKSGYRGVPASQIREMPAGLRMISGDPRATGPQNDLFGDWTCAGLDGKSIPAGCPAGSILELEFEFPQCWNGRDLDSPDHRSHMAFANPASGCPPAHPYPIPLISFNISWVVPDANATAAWRLSSDMYSGGPGGYSFHGDWFNGWDQGIENIWLPNCVRLPGDCTNNIGGGQALDWGSTRIDNR